MIVDTTLTRDFNSQFSLMTSRQVVTSWHLLGESHSPSVWGHLALLTKIKIRRVGWRIPSLVNNAAGLMYGSILFHTKLAGNSPENSWKREVSPTTLTMRRCGDPFYCPSLITQERENRSGLARWNVRAALVQVQSKVQRSKDSHCQSYTGHMSSHHGRWDSPPSPPSPPSSPASSQVTPGSWQTSLHYH